MIRGIAWSLGLLLMLCASGAHAGAYLSWQVTPDTPTVGDRISASLVLNHGADQAPLWDDVAPAFSGAEVDPVVTDRRDIDANGHPVSRRTYTLYADLPGPTTLPGVSVPLAGGGSATAAALTLTVSGAFDPDQAPPLAPAKAPLTVPLSWGVYALAGGVLLVRAGVLLWWWLRRPTVAPAAPDAPLPVPPRPARELALARLNALEAALPEMPSRPFFGELSAITCEYLADRYGIPAPVMSRVEIVSAIATPKRGRHHASELLPVVPWLDGWELFKFARMASDHQRRRQELDTVRAWLAGHPENGVETASSTLMSTPEAG